MVGAVSAFNMPKLLPDEVNFLAVMLGFKGAMHGFQKGVYDDEYFTLDPDCLTTYEAGERMVFIHDFINGQEPALKVLEFVKTTVALVDTELETCGYTGTVLKMQTFCQDNNHKVLPGDRDESFGIDENSPYPFVKIEADACSPRRITKNLYKRLFNVLGSYIRVNTMVK